MASNLISKVVTLLTNNWIAANTGSVTPTIANVQDKIRIGGDSVLIHNISNVPQDNAPGAATKERIQVVAVVMRTFTSDAQSILIQTEIERIFNANQVDPFSDQIYDISDITDVQDNNEQNRNYWSMKILVRFEQFNKAI